MHRMTVDSDINTQSQTWKGEREHQTSLQKESNGAVNTKPEKSCGQTQDRTGPGTKYPIVKETKSHIMRGKKKSLGLL